jgi:hypothetical protein
MRRLTTVTLASVLIAGGALRSHLLPWCLLGLMGALAGLLLATQMKDARDLVRVPVLVAVAVLALAGVGQLGVVGIVLGLVLLAVATPGGSARPRPGAEGAPDVLPADSAARPPHHMPRVREPGWWHVSRHDRSLRRNSRSS